MDAWCFSPHLDDPVLGLPDANDFHAQLAEEDSAMEPAGVEGSREVGGACRCYLQSEGACWCFDTGMAYRCALHGRMELPPDSHAVPIPMQMPHLSDQNKIL